MIFYFTFDQINDKDSIFDQIEEPVHDGQLLLLLLLLKPNVNRGEHNWLSINHLPLSAFLAFLLSLVRDGQLLLLLLLQLLDSFFSLQRDNQWQRQYSANSPGPGSGH